LSELRPVKNPKSKQVFYFDDFLGRTSLEKLQKNEDQRLVELMEEVSANPNWRFILTTRDEVDGRMREGLVAILGDVEDVLGSASSTSARVVLPMPGMPATMQKWVFSRSACARPKLEFGTRRRDELLGLLAPYCLATGDILGREDINNLLTHVYFSDVPKEYKLALLEERGYEKILTHRNYNPRVIEYMTQLRHAGTVAPTLYLREFIDSLDNPARLWDHAFRHQISEASRHLLLVLATLPDETKLDNLESAFWKFYEFRQKRFGFATSPGDWLDALKELDGNFIKTAKVGNDIVISFHNPSVKDFMEQFLANSDPDVVDLFGRRSSTNSTPHSGQGGGAGGIGGSSAPAAST